MVRMTAQPMAVRGIHKRPPIVVRHVRSQPDQPWPRFFGGAFITSPLSVGDRFLHRMVLEPCDNFQKNGPLKLAFFSLYIYMAFSLTVRRVSEMFMYGSVRLPL